MAALSGPAGAGRALSARRDLGRRAASTSRCSRPTRTRIELCLFDPQRTPRDRSASRCPNAPTRSGTATCRTRGRACSTAIARTAPTSRSTATASIRTSCCSIPMRAASAGELRWSDALFGYRVELAARAICRSTGATARRACRNAGRRPTRFTWGDDRPPERPWRDTVIYEAHVRGLHACCFPDLPPSAARHLRRRSPTDASSTTCGGSASRRSSCCRSTPSSTTARCSSRGCATTGATTRSASSRPSRATCRDGTARRVAGRWCGGCTPPASR